MFIKNLDFNRLNLKLEILINFYVHAAYPLQQIIKLCGCIFNLPIPTFQIKSKAK